MTTLRCCVIDDEPLASQLIASYIEKTPYMELAGVFASAQEAVRTVLEDDINLVFLDINMPQLNGMEFAKIIPSTCRIIFTTAYESYAMEGFKVNALDYLLKPISYEEFVTASNKAMEWAELVRKAGEQESARDYIMVKSDYKVIQIPTSSILYIEGLKDYVKIYLENEDKCIMTLLSMKTLEHELPATDFIRVHRSYIVNKSKIRTVERNRIVFGKNYIPISESYKDVFAEFVASRMLTAQRSDMD